MMIFADPAAALAAAYPSKPARLRHSLDGHPLFALPALLDLARRLPPASIEYNAGDIPIDQDPDKTPMTGLSVEETIRRIWDCNSWMALHNVGQDPEYAPVLYQCLAEIAPAAALATGPMYRGAGYIFISSPNAVTPLHLDPEHNILLHLAGPKKMTLYTGDRDIVPDWRHELYHVGKAHRNLAHNADFDAAAEVFDLAPGDALYVPVKAPHWVKTGGAPCVSFSITWRSRASDDEARLRIANHAIRRMGGAPPPPGLRRSRDAAAILAQRVASRLGAVFR